jgi:hypothetical protein
MTATAKKIEQFKPEITAHGLASECLKTTGNNNDAARELLRSRAMKDAKVRDVLIGYAIDGLIRASIIRTRSMIWTPPKPKNDIRTIVAVEMRINKSLLGFPLPGGKLLGEATKTEVLEAAQFYQSQGRDMMAKAAWLNAIAKAMGNSKFVAKALDDERLAALKEEVTQ